MTIDEKSAVDCIDRQATLNAIIKRLGIKNETYLLEAERAIYQQILAMPPVTPQETRWIPCSERLPEENGVYIISYEDAVTWLEWFNGKWFFYPSNPAREETGTIIAWMPLPEPYKTESEVK